MSVLLKAAIVLWIALLLQLELLSSVRVFDVMPELLIGVTVAAAWAGGADRGAIVGFAAGLAYDNFLPTPLGLGALAYTLVGFALGTVATAVADNADGRTRFGFQLFGILATILTYVTIGELLGESNLYGERFARVVIVGTFYTAVFLAPLNRTMRWVFGVETGRATRMPLSVLK